MNLLAEMMTRGIIAMIVAYVLITLWILVKCFELVVRVFLRYPHNRPMWCALGLFIVCLCLSSATSGRDPTVNSLVTLSFWTLVGTAKVVELYYDQLLQVAWGPRYVVDQVLHQPWWSLR